MENYEDLGIDLETFNKDEEIRRFEDLIEPVGWTLLIRLYTAPKKLKNIILPDQVQEEDLYRNCVGLVVARGKGVYCDERYKDTGAWCNKGDWVLFPRHAGYRILARGIPLWVLKEDAVDAKVSDPTQISKYLY